MKKLTAILATLLLLISFSNDAFAGKGDKKAKKNKKAKTEQVTEQAADTTTVPLTSDAEEETTTDADSAFDAALAGQAQEAQIAANQALIDSLVKAGNAANTEEIEELKASIQRIKNANAGNAQRITDLKAEVETVSSTANNAESTANQAATAIDTLTKQANKLEDWIIQVNTTAKKALAAAEGFQEKLNYTWVTIAALSFLFMVCLMVFATKMKDVRTDVSILVDDYRRTHTGPRPLFSDEEAKEDEQDELTISEYEALPWYKRLVTKKPEVTS